LKGERIGNRFFNHTNRSLSSIYFTLKLIDVPVIMSVRFKLVPQLYTYVIQRVRKKSMTAAPVFKSGAKV